MFWSWVFFLFLKSDFFPGFLCAVVQKCQSKRQGADANRPGLKEWIGGGWMCVCVWRRKGVEGCCYENSHKDRPSMIKSLVMFCKRNWRKKKKIPQKEKKIIKKGAKTRQSISTRTKNENVFKVKPWEQWGPWLQPDKSTQADEEQSGGARERTAAEDKGSAYPALLSFVCWFHFFFPDWVKPMAVVCQV